MLEQTKKESQWDNRVTQIYLEMVVKTVCVCGLKTVLNLKRNSRTRVLRNMMPLHDYRLLQLINKLDARLQSVPRAASGLKFNIIDGR